MKIQYPLVLDGGLSNELEKQGCDLKNKLWSAELLHSNILSIIEAHKAYLMAGAQCIITASYQASILGFTEHGFSKKEAKDLILKSVWAATQARKETQQKDPKAANAIIAASIGPYGAYLGDGSEYSGNYNITDDALREFHRERIEILDSSAADILACETIPGLQEAKVLSELLLHIKKPAWISFSCKDEVHTCDGTPIADCAALFAHHPKVFAIGVNCTKPKYISGLIKNIKTTCGDKKIIIYPNSGEIYNATSKSWVGFEDKLSCEMMAKQWLIEGADIIGGCCRVGPEQISSIKHALNTP